MAKVDKRDNKIVVRLTDDEKARLDEYVKKNSLVTASWARILLMREVANG